MLKGLPSGYNKDMQEDKALLFDAVDTLLTVAADRRAKPSRGCRSMREALRRRCRWIDDLLATDLADELVRRGVPFREAHGIVGRLLRAAEAAHVRPRDLDAAEWAKVDPRLVTPAKPAISAENSVDARRAIGGTARSAVVAQLNAAAAALRA